MKTVIATAIIPAEWSRTLIEHGKSLLPRQSREAVIQNLIKAKVDQITKQQKEAAQ